ncbi:MAG: hypothetical protein RR575_08300 [Acinetobacter sp.]
MDMRELMNYIDVGMTKPVIVNRVILEGFGSYMRTIGFYERTKVEVSYFYYDGSDEDTGIDIKLKYDSIENAVASIEQFLRTPLSEWENLNRTGYYPEPLDYSYEVGWDDLEKNIKEGIFIPKGYTSMSMYPYL